MVTDAAVLDDGNGAAVLNNGHGPMLSDDGHDRTWMECA